MIYWVIRLEGAGVGLRVVSRRPDVWNFPMDAKAKNSPGLVRDAILSVLTDFGGAAYGCGNC